MSRSTEDRNHDPRFAYTNPQCNDAKFTHVMSRDIKYLYVCVTI